MLFEPLICTFDILLDRTINFNTIIMYFNTMYKVCCCKTRVFYVYMEYIGIIYALHFFQIRINHFYLYCQELKWKMGKTGRMNHLKLQYQLIRR